MAGGHRHALLPPAWFMSSSNRGVQWADRQEENGGVRSQKNAAQQVRETRVGLSADAQREVYSPLVLLQKNTVNVDRRKVSQWTVPERKQP